MNIQHNAKGKLQAARVVLCSLLFATQIPFVNSAETPPGSTAQNLNTSVPVFEVNRFRIRYTKEAATRHPELPSESELEKITVRLKQSQGVMVPLNKTQYQGETQTIPLSAGGKTRKYTPEALLEAISCIVARLNKVGIYGVYVTVESQEIENPENQTSLQTDESHVLTFRVSLTEGGIARSTRYQLPIREGIAPEVNREEEAWIKAKSPITTGGLLRKDALQEYLDRLNRFPGRRVDTALSEGETQDTVDINYIIREERRLFCNYQISNTGSSHTPQWRSQLGLETRHLGNWDDVLRGSYATNDFQNSNSGQFSYEFPLISPDYLKSRVYGSAAHTGSEDLGQSAGAFNSSQYSLGQQFTWTPRHLRGWPLDLSLGAYWMHAAVTNGATDISSNTDFFLPYFSLGTARQRETYSLLANTQFETNMAGLAGTQRKDFAALGRFDADRHFSVLRWNINGSLWLDPIFYGKEWEDAKVWWKATRSHEITATFRGQSALDGARLVPQMEAVVGGFDTVRGYPESYTAADTAMISSLEYKFHVARQCIEPASERAHKTKNALQRNAPAESQNDATSANRSSFAFRPPVAASVADWDLILRTFIDYAQTQNNKILPGLEANRTLLGAGFGIELQTYKPAFCTIRADVGFALRGDHQISGNHVDAGDARLHVSATFAW